MRVCIRKSDGRIIDSQSNDQGDLETLYINASYQGYERDKVECKILDDKLFSQELSEQISADLPPKREVTKTELLQKIQDISIQVEELKE